MGMCNSTGNSSSSGFYSIVDQYETIEQVQEAMQKAGLEASDLIIGVDFTKSNLWQGKRTFDGKCLHDVSGAARGIMNPYQETIDIIGRTLSRFDDDGQIPAYGFGDSKTKNKSVFPLNGSFKDSMCDGFDGVLGHYNNVARRVDFSGPTTFAPLIDKAIEIVKHEGTYHILLIVCDGAVTDKARDARAIARACKYPLSIICVGVGDGPWDVMEEFDDEIPDRTWDNFQFVDWNAIKKYTRGRSKQQREAAFALNALMEIPEQYKICKARGIISACAAEAALYGDDSQHSQPVELRPKGAYGSDPQIIDRSERHSIQGYKPGQAYSGKAGAEWV